MSAGTPLKTLLGPSAIELLADALALADRNFDRRGFRTAALRGLEELELMARGNHIAGALATFLPTDFAAAAKLVIAALGPELTATEGNGLRPFFYLPISAFIARFGTDNFEAGMEANYELTKRMTAEFSIRPFLVQHRAAALRKLAKWTKDANPHVRRLVSEGTRPRLPWASRLPEFQQNPDLALPLLEKLRDDDELYVRRSVANHLGDILKDHPEVVYALCEEWLGGLARKSVTVANNRRWIIRHAVRLPAKRSDARALALRLQAQPQ